VAVADYRGRLRSQLLELLQAKVLRDTSHWVGCYVTRSFSVLTIAIATPLRPHATTILDLNSDDALGRGRVVLLLFWGTVFLESPESLRWWTRACK
jgi:hypothetical protein